MITLNKNEVQSIYMIKKLIFILTAEVLFARSPRQFFR